MTPETVTSLMLSSIGSYGLAASAILGAVIVLLVGFLVFRFGMSALWHSDGTTNWLGRHWSWYDRMTYKPWKGYNRLRSRSWNMAHMP